MEHGISESSNEQKGTYEDGIYQELSGSGRQHKRPDLCFPTESHEPEKPYALRHSRPGEIQACGDKSRREGSRTENRGYVKGDDGMDRKTLFDMECELMNECEDYIQRGSEPKDEEMEACVKAFEAVQQYRFILQKKEKAPGGANT